MLNHSSLVNLLWRSALILTTSGLAVVFGNCAVAQIQPDNTLGEQNSIVNDIDALNKRIDGGVKLDANLFHSFREFNVSEGGSVYFANPQGITDIFSRVTGDNPSNIFGKLGVLGDANLFLINPNGIVFGENASLDLQGSFVASTANGIEFGEQGSFSATNPETPRLLNVNPSALFFNQVAAQPIVNKSRADAGKDPSNSFDTFGLRVPDGKSFLLIGGDINIDAGGIVAFGGRVDLASIAGKGEVELNQDRNNLSLNVADTASRGNITLTNDAGVIVTAGDGGDIAIAGKNIDILGGSSLNAGILSQLGSVDAQAGDITLNATEKITITNLSKVNNNVNSDAIGNSGDINIVGKLVEINDGAEISANTNAKGNAGSINILGEDTVSVKDSENNSTFIFNNNISSEAVGDTNGINITTGSLFVNDGAQIQSLVSGEGNSGRITINARDQVSLDGRGTNDFPSLVISRVEVGAVGNGGDVDITTSSLSMTNRAQIISATQGRGNAGNISIEAQNQVFLLDSDIITEVSEEGGIGKGGDININTGNLLLQDGSSLLADVENFGKAGNITINVRDRMVVEGEGLSAFANSTNIFPSQVTATVDYTGVGEGGEINISARTLLVADKTFIRTDNFGIGKAGNINITADSIFVDGGEISSDVIEGTIGDGGNIKIIADSLSLANGGVIATSTFSTGKAGEITINLSDSLTIDGVGSGLFAITHDTTVASETSNAGQSLSTSQDLTNQNGQLVTGIRGILLNDNDVDIYQISLPGNQTFSATTANRSTNVDTRLFLFDANGGGVYFNDDENDQTRQSTLPARHPLTPQKAGNYYLAITSYENEPLNKDGTIFGLGSFTDILGATGNGGSQPLSSWSNNGTDIGTYVVSINDSSTTPAVISGGTGGSINVRAESLSISNGAQINAESRGQGRAGNIKIDVEGALNANNGSILTSAEQSSGGAINITAKDIRLFDDSDIATNVFNGTGGGGNINLTANTIIALDDSDILSFAGDGKGGNITFNTEGFFSKPLYNPSSSTNSNANALTELDNNNRVDVNASGVVSGTVTGVPDTRFIQDSLTDLPDNQIDTNTIIANSCVVRSNQQNGTFLITGSGGLPINPSDAPLSNYSTGSIRSIPSNSEKSPAFTNPRPWKIGDPNC